MTSRERCWRGSEKASSKHVKCEKRGSLGGGQSYIDEARGLGAAVSKLCRGHVKALPVRCKHEPLGELKENVLYQNLGRKPVVSSF